MRLRLAVLFALTSCAGATAEPAASPPPSPPPPSPPPVAPPAEPIARSVTPPAPPPAPALPTTLASTSGFERPATAISFTPPKGTVAASCRVPETGELALALHPETVPRALAPCKAPAGARFIVRIEATGHAPNARDVTLQEGGSAKDASCVRAALLKTGLFFETSSDDAPRLYDCYVAFY